MVRCCDYQHQKGQFMKCVECRLLFRVGLRFSVLKHRFSNIYRSNEDCEKMSGKICQNSWMLIGGSDVSTTDRNRSTDDFLLRLQYALKIWWAKPHAIYKQIVGSIEIDSLPSNVSWHGISEQQFSDYAAYKIRKFVPKQSHVFSSESFEIFLLRSSGEAEFYPGFGQDSSAKNQHIACAYKFQLDTGCSKLKLFARKATERDAEWLRECLFPKIVSWFSSCDTSVEIVESLRLVDLVQYTNCYNRLKKSYAQKIIDDWTETTNPEKFVHEDIAIASYLICYWNSAFGSEASDQTFLDLGCGNGLLCYILSAEGFKGYGFDVRKRKIWDTYGPQTVLMEKSLDPSDVETLMKELPKCDWLIGNHSDELTPWIPVIAARMTAKYFLLPCCAWDFYGKYQRLESGLSRYRSYLNYVKQIGERIGFTVEEDRMKIPSTKRVCFIGTLKPEQHSDIFLNLENILKFHTDSKQSQQFEPRSSTEMVKNCTKLDKTLQERIVNLIAKALLDQTDEASWNAGGMLTLSECSQLLTADEKKALKDQCGGLQTLLRNHHQTFLVMQGCVKIRDWRQENEMKNVNRRSRPCWFFLNHPNGCPLPSDLCQFQHNDSDS